MRICANGEVKSRDGGGCLQARGIGDGLLVEGVCRSSLDQLTDWTVWADKVITF